MRSLPSTGWLTINRGCNLRCQWCYAKDTGYAKCSDMSLENAKKAIDLFKEVGVKSVVLIGGEPTVYEKLPEVIKYCSERQLKVYLVSNGVRLKDEEYTLSLRDAGLYSYTISLKGNDRENFKEIAQVDKFDDIIDAIKVLKKNNLRFACSMVLNEDNIDTFITGVQNAIDAGAKFFSFSFCYEFNTTGDKEFIKKNNPFKLVKKFMEIYPRLDELTKGNFTIDQALPLCIWDQEFIKNMEKKNQLKSVCQLLRRRGLILDPELNIIPCNAMHKIKLGKYGVEFTTGKELLQYINSEEVNEVFNKLNAVPHEKCLKCELYKYCGGGCVTQWTNYSFDDLEVLKKDI